MDLTITDVVTYGAIPSLLINVNGEHEADQRSSGSMRAHGDNSAVVP